MESPYGGLKLSKTVIFPVQKCLKYAVAKNAGEKKKITREFECSLELPAMLRMVEILVKLTCIEVYLDQP